ncbi:MAG: OprO/OprP family phosphate-selective porin [Bacteroidaceae bacterium]|nr:OprO/OprP family phosphate-selective porin [Bacteroidaceae bacterium]
MKKLLAILLLAGCTQGVVAQNDASEKTLFEEITGVKKKTDKFNLYLNMNMSYDAMDGYSDPVKNKFNVRQLRIEAKGNVNDWLSYRWRQRLNRSNAQGNNIDNAPTSIDIAGIGVKLSDKWSIFAGKQCAAYGGIEFDLNPIEIYEYSDMIDYMSNFMTGLNIGYDFAAGQQLNFQVLNSLNGTFAETYGDVEYAEASKTPLVYTLNWNGNFNNVFKTRWSASIMNQAKGEKMTYFALGNELSLGKFGMFLDFMYSKEDIDRKRILTSMLGGGASLPGAEYMSIVTKLNYRFTPNWNVFVKGMYETASLDKKVGSFEDGKYRTSLGYLAGLEYYPMENSNLHFFLTYVGRKYNYTNKVDLKDYDTNRLSVGFIYQLQMF